MLRNTLLTALIALCVFSGYGANNTKTWEEAKESGRAELTAYWYTSQPFIYENANGLTGIEYEIIELFRQYIYDTYGVKVDVKWIQPESFKSAFDLIALNNSSGMFAASAFSITEDRMEKVDFTEPYLSDISVLISNSTVPVVRSIEEFDSVFQNLTAITIEGTTYENDLKEINDSRRLDFKILYIPSIENVLDKVEGLEGSFGFIDLPIYLKEFKDNTTVGVKRQNFFTIKRKGLAFPLPKNSDWKEPFDEFLQSRAFKDEVVKIISKYLDYEVYSFVESIYGNPMDEITLLETEKELQRRDLSVKTEQIKEEEMLKNISIISALVILAFSLVIFQLYRKSRTTTNLLREQKSRISEQNEDIQKQKEQLEGRNNELNRLNEEKNNLINILAHDLRSPINNIHGLAHVLLLNEKHLNQEQNQLIHQISDSSKRLSAMITKVLDIDRIESNSVNLKEEDIDLDVFLNEIITEFQFDAKKKGITLYGTNHVKQKELVTDKFYLRQIIENLVSNALKFSPLDKSVHIEITGSEKAVQFSVQDEGPGLSEMDSQDLFKKYQKLSARPTAGEPSMGLGLSIVKKYVEIIGGDIQCQSDLGKGANFILTLRWNGEKFENRQT
jgi:signal transduction histidine kinase